MEWALEASLAVRDKPNFDYLDRISTKSCRTPVPTRKTSPYLGRTSEIYNSFSRILEL